MLELPLPKVTAHCPCLLVLHMPSPACAYFVPQFCKEPREPGESGYQEDSQRL